MAETEIAPLAPTRIRQKVTTSMKHTRWTQEEDDLLIDLVSKSEHVNWSEITKNFTGKTVQQVSERWGKVVNPNLVKGSWTRQEDEIIIDFVRQYGTKNWTKLASFLPGRIGKQCRERWRNHLDPDVNRDPWSPDEDNTLIALHEQYGNQWVKISSLMPGRSDNSIKNRWNSTLRKRPSSVGVRYTPPKKSGDHKVETPSSVESTLPRPVIFDSNGPSMESDPSWTPRLVNFDVVSPFLQMKSPFAFASPLMKSDAMMTPWSPGFSLKTPTDSIFSPRLASPSLSENRTLLLNVLDSLDKEQN